MWTTSRLTEEQYLDFFEVFTKNTDQYDRATESIVRFLATKNKPFKVLLFAINYSIAVVKNVSS